MSLHRLQPPPRPARQPLTPERRAALARAIQAGTYRPDLQRLAEALIAEVGDFAPRRRAGASH